MKKKGLLISTIIMVVVLVASLTTATYAWFSATASVKIDTMQLSTTATKGLVIGALGDTGYLNGSLSWKQVGNGGYWEGGSPGLGSSVTFAGKDGNFGLSVEKACTPWSPSGSTLVAQAIASGFMKSGTSGAYVKAAGQNGNNNADVSTSGSVEIANMNDDYIDLKLGVSASSANSVLQAYGTIIITNFDVANLGMAGALHMIIKVTDGSSDNATTGSAPSGTIVGSGNLGKDVFYKELTLDAKNTTNSGFGTLTTSGSTSLTIQFPIFTGSDTSGSKLYMDSDQVKPAVLVEIITWFEGYDASCTNDNTGIGDCQMEINFDYVATGNTAKTFSGFAIK